MSHPVAERDELGKRIPVLALVHLIVVINGHKDVGEVGSPKAL